MIAVDLNVTALRRGATIFVAEDEPDAAAFTELALRRVGHDPVVFSHPTAALDALSVNDCDLLLSDVRLPDMSGLELLERVRQRRHDLPVVLMTAFATVNDAIVALRHGASDYLLKPLTVQSLAEGVAGALAARDTDSDRILAIGAHPDDVEIGVGATLAGHSRRGDHVTILTLSNGESGGQPEVRRTEAQLAAEMLGADLVLGSLPDTRISEHGLTVKLIEDIVSSLNPTTVYTHSSHDVHQDHRATHQASLISCRSVSQLLCYQSPSATVGFAPNRFVTVDNTVDQKLAAIAAYQSQIDRSAYLAEDLLRATPRYWGRFGAGRHAEPLEIVRDQVERTSLHEHDAHDQPVGRDTTERERFDHAINVK